MGEIALEDLQAVVVDGYTVTIVTRKQSLQLTVETPEAAQEWASIVEQANLEHTRREIKRAAHGNSRAPSKKAPKLSQAAMAEAGIDVMTAAGGRSATSVGVGEAGGSLEGGGGGGGGGLASERRDLLAVLEEERGAA
eukprot:UC1_evm1s1258